MSSRPATPAAPLLVVAGEPSGDVMAARVVERLPVRVVGMGGSALARAGADLSVCDPRLASLGPTAALRQLPRLLLAFRRVLRVADASRVRVALLVGFSGFNGPLGKRLRQRGIRVLWYSPPQVWAWRSSRAARCAESCDRAALILPFEARLWRAAGAEALSVGHPSTELSYASRGSLRRRLGFADGEPAVALLPGSRTAEVRRMLEPMLEACSGARQSRARAVVLLAEQLPEGVRSWAASLAQRHRVPWLSGCESLPAFDVALATSGTVTLECALTSVPPVIAYRTDTTTAFLAKRFLETDHIGLPNVVLGQRCFPELLQSDVNAGSLHQHMHELLDHHDSYVDACARVRTLLRPHGSPQPSELVAKMVSEWLG